MPLYVYRCKAGHEVEELKLKRPADPDAASECPICTECGRLTRLAPSSPAHTPAKWGDTKKIYHGV